MGELRRAVLIPYRQSGQPHPPATLIPGISASLLNQQEAGGAVSQSGGFGEEKTRLTCRK